MSKAILVIDMPNECRDCPCCEIWEVIPSIEECTCSLEGTGVDKYDKPNWCPLKELPTRVEVFMDDWAEGYNACLEDILGE